MPSFGATSEKHLATCHPYIQRVLREAIKHKDFAVTCGFRNQADQHAAFVTGKSKLDWPNGDHNQMPSFAADVAPWVNGGIDWNDAEAFTYLSGFIIGIGAAMGIKLACGIDWDNDGNVREHSFKDRPHIFLVR